MPRIKHHRSSRRVPPPKDSDFDHEIGLVDHSASGAESQTEEGDSVSRAVSRDTNSIAGPSASQRDTPASDTLVANSSDVDARLGRNTTQATQGEEGSKATAAGKLCGPSVQVEQPTPDVEFDQPRALEPMSRSRPKTPESAIDILYENQRGGFLCGIGLFSSKALGNLDPSPWTNSVHKTSPTDITNAQVPDPSWEWAWPEWRINHADGVDEDGWEYSFMFSKKFSWHRPSWWNSFVRRRAWIRKRVRKDAASKHLSQDTGSMMLNPEYFSVRPSSEIERCPSRLTSNSLRERQKQRAPSTGSQRNSRVSMSTGVDDTMQEDIESVDGLLMVLRQSRIDREKIEAVDNYLENSSEEELEGLQDIMHEVMAIFVFQASRRVLLTRLTQVYDQTVDKANKLKKNKGHNGRPSTEKPQEADGVGKETDEAARLKKRAENLAQAIKHADEEVRRLEYWSDVKGMAEKGESKGAVDRSQGWDPSWQGVDNSGPSEPPPPEDAHDSKSRT